MILATLIVDNLQTGVLSAGALHAWELHAAAGGCPTAPSTQVQQYADNIVGWVKWGVLSILAVSFFASTGMLIWGRVTHHPKGARLGFDGLMICLLGAILYVAGFTVITGITGC